MCCIFPNMYRTHVNLVMCNYLSSTENSPVVQNERMHDCLATLQAFNRLLQKVNSDLVQSVVDNSCLQQALCSVYSAACSVLKNGTYLCVYVSEYLCMHMKQSDEQLESSTTNWILSIRSSMIFDDLYINLIYLN